MKKTIFLLSLLMGCSGWALQCTPPTTISDPKGSQWFSRIAMNANSATTVVWIKSIGDSYVLQAATRSNLDAQWTPVQTISDPMNIQMHFPFVTADGIASVIWKSLDQNKAPQYYFSKKENTNSSWSLNKLIKFNELPNIKDINFDRQGDPFVLASPSSQEFEAYSFHCTVNDQATPIKSYDELPRFSTSNKIYVPQIIKNRQGTTAVLWSHEHNWGIILSDKDYRFQIAQYQEKEKAWDSAVKIIDIKMGFKDLDNDKAKDISATFNKDGNFAILWSHFDSGSSKHILKTIVKSKSPAKLEEIATAGNFADSAILMDDEGNTIAVWIKQFNSKNVVFATIRPKDKDAWQGEPVHLSDINHNADCIEINYINDTFVVVWAEEDNKKSSIHGTTLSNKANKLEWSSPVLLSPPDQNCWYPSMAFNDKEGIITWTTHLRYSKDYQIQVAKLMVE